MNLYAALPFFLGIHYANAFEYVHDVTECQSPEHMAVTYDECKGVNGNLSEDSSNDYIPYGCGRWDDSSSLIWNTKKTMVVSPTYSILCKKYEVDFSAWEVNFKSCDFKPDDEEKRILHCAFETLTGKDTKIVFSDVVEEAPTCNKGTVFGNEGDEQVDAAIFTKELDISSSVTAVEKNEALETIERYFCVKANVHDVINGEDAVVNFSSKLIKLEMNYNSEGTFAVIESVKIEENDISTETRIRDESVKIKAFRCNQSDGAEILSNDVLNQGDILSLCVKPESTGISILQIKTLNFVYGLDNEISYDAITGSSTNAVTSSTCPWDDEMCMIDTLVIASFVNVGNGQITASGVAEIEYVRRSLNGEELDPRRLVKSENEEDVGFNIIIALAEPIAESRIVLSGSLGMNYPVVHVTILLGMFSLLV